MTLALAAGLIAIATLLGSREVKAYRYHRSATYNDGTDLFVYTKGRFLARLGGVCCGGGFGVALVGWELLPPRSPEGLSVYLAVFGTLIIGLFVTVISDFMITAKTARPAQVKRQGRPEDPGR